MKKKEGSKSTKNPRLSIKAIFFFNPTINIISTAIFLVTIGTQLFKVRIRIGETALFYFFSSIAQSMAAIIALAGTVAIFRYSFLTDKLKDSLTWIQERFNNQDVYLALGQQPYWTRSWADDKILPLAKLWVKGNRIASCHQIEIEKEISEAEIYQGRLDNFVSHVQPPFIASFATFVLSVFMIPFSGGMASLAVGVYFWELFTFLIVITSYNLYCYFVGTATLGKDA